MHPRRALTLAVPLRARIARIARAALIAASVSGCVGGDADDDADAGDDADDAGDAGNDQPNDAGVGVDGGADGADAGADGGVDEADAGDAVVDAGPCALLEPNDDVTTRASAPLDAAVSLAICGDDEDWFALEIPAATMLEIGLVTADGELDLTLHDIDIGATCVASRVDDDDCGGTGLRTFETNEERFSVVDVTSYAARVIARPAGSDGTYTFATRALPWADGADCAALFDAQTCEGRPGGAVDLLPFPLPDRDGDVYALATPSNYRYARREAIMLVRDALRTVDVQFAATRVVELGDVSQRDGLDPGVDVGALRHVGGTHEEGRGIDVAYYNTLDAEPLNELRVICDAAGGSATLGTCDPGAPHVVDVPRQAVFIATLFGSPRVGIVQVDAAVLDELRAEADGMRAGGVINDAQHAAFTTLLRSAEQRHTHVHVGLFRWE